MFNLTGKVTVVTGGGSGIGAAIVSSFVSAGAIVWIIDRDAVGAETVANSNGAKVRFLACDIADEAAVQAAAVEILQRHGCVDVVVNNAGVGHVGTALGTTATDMERVWRVNTMGTFFVTQAFLPKMIENCRGSVINVSSIGGVVGVRDRLAYCASKHAVVGMTRCMALDHAESGVRFNAICPGRAETPFVTARLNEYPDTQAAYQVMAASQALGRMGRPEEIAAAAVYLASDEAEFVTGSALIIDGGFSAGK